MITLYLVLFVFIIIIFIINKKEFFTVNNCYFVPWGTSQDTCVLNCKHYKKKNLWDLGKDGKDCTDDVCKEICNKCDNEERCEWVIEKREREKLFQERKINYNKENILIPNPVMISNVKDVITFTRSDIYKPTKYILNITDLDKVENNVKVLEYNTDVEINVNDILKAFNKNKNDNYNYIVVLYILNKHGISNPSNPLILSSI